MSRIVDESKIIRLDTLSLEARAALLPEELREPFIWLGSYVREECSREISILTERARKLSITIDITNWSKILRGRWDRDGENNPTEHPCVALPKLLKAIEALRKDSRIKEQGGAVPFIETSTTQTIFNFLDQKRTPDRVCKFGVVIGETGNQKTASFKEYCRQNNHGACIWTDAPATPSMSIFMSDLARHYGLATQSSWAKLQQAVTAAVNDRRTIIVENVQRLYNPRLEGNQPIFNYLQKLQEDTGCTIIISFTPVFERTFTLGLAKGFFEQFEGRAGGRKNFLRLPEHPPEEDVLAIAQAFKLVEAEKHLDYLVAISHESGRIRILFETLQKATIRAAARKEKLTIAHLKYVRDED